MLYADLHGVVDVQGLIGDSAPESAICEMSEKATGTADAKGLEAITLLRAAKQRSKAICQHFPLIFFDVFSGRVYCRLFVNSP